MTDTLQKAPETLEQAQQVVAQATTVFDKLMQEAPLPVIHVLQVNVRLVQALEALAGILENMWNPDAGQPPGHLGSRAINQTSSVMMAQE